MAQNFTVKESPTVSIQNVKGDLIVQAGEAGMIRVMDDEGATQISQVEGNLQIMSSGDLKLWVPVDTTLQLGQVGGDVRLEGLRKVTCEAIRGDLSVRNVAAVEIHAEVRGDVHLVGSEQVEIEIVGGDLSVQQMGTALFGTVNGDIEAMDISAAWRCGNVSGDCQIHSGPDSTLLLGNVNGDVEIVGSAQAQIGNVGGDCVVKGLRGKLEIGHTGGDLLLQDIGSDVEIGTVNGDGSLKGLQGSIEAGGINGDMLLQMAHGAGSQARLNVAGDAVVNLPDAPNLSLRALVVGDVSGGGAGFGGHGNLLNLTYGAGEAQLSLNVGGDLALRGQGMPRTSSSTSSSWGDFEAEMTDLGRKMGQMGQDLGREMSRLAQDLARDLSHAGIIQGTDWVGEQARKVEEQARKVEEQAQNTRKQAEELRASQRPEGQVGERLNVRINNREWRMDPERLERITEQAKRAASEGVVGALEAVERALKNLGLSLNSAPPVAPTPPTPPTPPSGPTAFTPPTPPTPPTAPTPPTPPTGPTAAEKPSAGSESPAPVAELETAPAGLAKTEPRSESNVEQEREAILRMIAEGRISPEEGDLLLESLGD